MAIPLKELVSLGFTLAKDLVPDAFTPNCTVRLNPTIVVDPVADTKVVTWQTEKTGLSLLGFDDSDERDKLPLNVRQRTFLLNGSDYPPGVPFKQEAEVVAEGITWNVYRAEVAPGGSVVLLYGRA